MRGSQSSFANSSASERPDSGIASRAQKIPRNHSRSSINFDACNSPDFNSVVLEKELSALDLEDQGPRSVSFASDTRSQGQSPPGDALLQSKLREEAIEPEGGSPTSSHHRLSHRSLSAHMSSVPHSLSFADLTTNFEKDVEEVYGAADPSRNVVRNARRIIVKVGTAVVTRGKDHRLALGRLGALVEQLEALVRSGRQVILVTSGGVSVGRQKLMQQKVLNSSPLQMQTFEEGPNTIKSRAAAAAGQSGLMALYDNLFGLMDLQAAQVLVTAHDFAEPVFKENLCATVEDLLSMNVVPVFNENDAISKGAALSKDNSPFWDNDSLAALLAVELKADLLMLMTDVGGLYTGPPTDPTNTVIPAYCPELHDSSIKYGDKSSGGRGGMLAKVDAAWKAASGGVTAVIASGKGGDCLIQCLAGQQVGTMFNMDAAKKLLADRERVLQRPLGNPPANSMKQNSQLAEQSPRSKATKARKAARILQSLDSKDDAQVRERILHRIADAIEASSKEITKANNRDMAHAEAVNTDTKLVQCLELKPHQLRNLSVGVRSVADRSEPIGQVLKRTELAEGLLLEKVTCPIGVLLAIFESRPEALPQMVALAIRSGNGLLVKGGKDASWSFSILHALIKTAIAEACPEVGEDLIGLVTSQEDVDDLLQLDEVIDLVIPQGSKSLVSHAQQNTRIPVMGYSDSFCHMYIDAAADINKACSLAVDSKIDCPTACNALERLLVHEDFVRDGRLFQLMAALRDRDVCIYGGEKASHALGIAPAPASRVKYGTMEVTLELVGSMGEAINHIHEFSSGHSEAIVTENSSTAEEFLRRVDSACLHVNASTRFSDGFRYGLGAEVAVSTWRLHARGPVGVEGLFSTKYLLRGRGHTVEKDSKIQYTHKELSL